MKKQFFRVKQLADQTFLRADRSELMNNEELKQAESKVDYIQKVISEVHKKLPISTEKKKKCNELILASTMQECSMEGDEVELLPKLLKECSSIEQYLAERISEYETELDSHVGQTFGVILDKEIPNILKLKKNLHKYILDKDSATNRYHNSTKNGTQNTNLKDDMDEADIKVDQSRDLLAIDMFGLLREQSKVTTSLVMLLKLQKQYHESALKYLESAIPNLEQMIGNFGRKPIFGTDLVEHLNQYNRKLAYPLELCVVALTEFGMSEEGLFRVAGGSNRVKRFKLSIDSGCFALPLIQEYSDVHVLASALKLYLRELPEPLLTFSMYDDWMNVLSKPEDQRIKLLQEILKKLPEQNMNNLAFLIHFLAKLSKHPENKMTPSNIAIVISPNLLWAKEPEMNANMKYCTAANMIVELFINNVNKLFPDDMLSEVKIRREEIITEEFRRSELTSLRNSYTHFDGDVSETASPKPQIRKKAKPAAPAPPPNHKLESDLHSNHTPSYPSGSSTLNRSHKIRTETPILQSKPSIQHSQEDLFVTEIEKINQNHEPLVKTESPAVDCKFVNTPPANIQVNKSKPVQQVTAQLITTDNTNEQFAKPVAAPRTSLMEAAEKNVNQFVRRDSISRSMNAIDIDGESVQTRRSSKEDFQDKPGKPAIPVRPASLRATQSKTIEIDPSLQKTQCSIYNMPNKQQPSIVNIQKPVGHDNQMAEKEKFLGHQPAPRSTVENKYSDINSNCSNMRQMTINKPDLPSKPPHVKSNEKLNDVQEKINGNSKTSHIRTRSDGNIVDIHGDGVPTSLLQTPPSPRSLNKPSQPPPPPPTVNKTKMEAETTTF